LGWSAQEAGFLPSLWFSRLAMVVVVGGVALLLRIRRRARGEVSTRVMAGDVSFAAAVGLVEIAGGLAYARGAEVGLVSIVTAASATYPLVPVIGSVGLLKERPSALQYVGLVLVVAGLATLGLAS
jgi:drug/metabolite transporter (DMT)-like permease